MRIVKLTVASLRAAIGASMERRLVAARAAKTSIANVAAGMFADLEELGMQFGFLPDEPPEVKDGLTEATVTVLCWDYHTELTVTA